jgi:hypothetical protein
VSCRLTSHPDRIGGKEFLGMRQVEDPDSPLEHMVPTPPVLGAQLEGIIYSRFLRPLSGRVLWDLMGLMETRQTRYWYTFYLVLFLMLHSCAMLTRRDMEYAVRVCFPVGLPPPPFLVIPYRKVPTLETRDSSPRVADIFANQTSIHKLMCGATTLLAHFHFAMKGSVLFRLALSRRCVTTPE